MKKFLYYSLGVLCVLLNVATVNAAEKFEVLPDLPDPLVYASLPAQAATVTGTSDVSSIATQSIGNEPSFISVLLSLIFVILLIYFTGIIYAKLNKVGFKTLKRQQGDFARSHVSVVSTTQLGNNKTLHVVELDGKRMLIGASSSAIQLIKDLGNVNNGSDEEFSHIEIPNIKIPKIEIPKIEIPTINFSRHSTKTHKPMDEVEKESEEQKTIVIEESSIADNSEQVNPEGIIDSLFALSKEESQEDVVEMSESKLEHVVDPDDFALYKKYLS